MSLYTAIDEVRDANKVTEDKVTAFHEENISMKQQLGRLEAAVAKMELELKHINKQSGNADGNDAGPTTATGMRASSVLDTSILNEKDRLRGPQNWRRWLNSVTDELLCLGYSLRDKRNLKDNKPFTAQDEAKIGLLVLGSVTPGPRELVANMVKGTKMITKLNARYGGQTEEPLVLVWEKLQDKRYDGGCPIKHVRDFNGLVDKNRDLGNVFTKSQLVAMFLRGVSDSNSDQAQAWATRSRETVRSSAPSTFTTLNHLHKSFMFELRDFVGTKVDENGKGKYHDDGRKGNSKSKRKGRGRKKATHGTAVRKEDRAVEDGWGNADWSNRGTWENSDAQGKPDNWDYGNTWGADNPDMRDNAQGEADSWDYGNTRDHADTSGYPDTWNDPDTQGNGDWIRDNPDTQGKSDSWVPEDTWCNEDPGSPGTQGNADWTPYNPDTRDNITDSYGNANGCGDLTSHWTPGAWCEEDSSDGADSWYNDNSDADEDQKADSWDEVEDHQHQPTAWLL